MKKAISRDILVPANMTLHALDYAILRVFGWQNSHLHSFYLPSDIYEFMTNNLFKDWSKLAGIYFRFPTDNFEDIYWDDNYKEGQSLKTWMKRKYTGPYAYDGYGEHYIINQTRVLRMINHHPVIELDEYDPELREFVSKGEILILEATMEQLLHAFMMGVYDELIERLPLCDLLTLSNDIDLQLGAVTNR